VEHNPGTAEKPDHEAALVGLVDDREALIDQLGAHTAKILLGAAEARPGS
jgi:hypothetical protein